VRHFSDPHPAWETKVPENPTLIGTLKDLPLRAVPFIIFPGACGIFGELLLRVPATPALAQTLASWVLALFTVAAGAPFFHEMLFWLAPNAWSGFS
jgi:hypothetical protein